MGLRWEWRTFGEPLGAAGERLGSMPPEKVTESDETYLLAPASLDAVKARAELMDVKHLEAVDDDGLELWEPVMKAPLPVSAADAATGTSARARSANAAAMRTRVLMVVLLMVVQRLATSSRP